MAEPQLWTPTADDQVKECLPWRRTIFDVAFDTSVPTRTDENAIQSDAIWTLTRTDRVTTQFITMSKKRKGDWTEQAKVIKRLSVETTSHVQS